MEFTLPTGTLLAFLLALVRASAWTAVAPPFNSRIIPIRVKTGVSAALAIACVPHLPADRIPTDLGPFLAAVLAQILIGLSLGFLTQLLFGAVQTAGALIDVLGGFSISQALDPLLNMQNSVMGRFYEILATTLLFVIGGHLLLIHGFVLSFDALPLSAPPMNHIAAMIVHDLAKFGLAALEIGAPLIAALFLSELVLGIMAKAAPQMNVFMLSFPFKILLVVILIGFALPLLPNAVSSLLNETVRDGTHLLRAGT